VVLGASLLSSQPAMGAAYGEIEVLDVSAPIRPFLAPVLRSRVLPGSERCHLTDGRRPGA
jgi:hypothetical protein